MIKEVKGNLLDLFDEGKFDVIIHGCNCMKLMGSGIAAQIKERYPIAYSVDCADTRKPINRLGDFTIATVIGESMQTIINLYSQFLPGRALDYEALILGLRKIKNIYETNKNYRIGLPQIGCGIAGGDWNRVKKIIEQELEGLDITIVYYEAK